MASTHCALCGEPLGFLSLKTKIADGVVCTDCTSLGYFSSFDNAMSYNSDSLKALILRRHDLVPSFTKTKSVGSYLLVDEVHKLFKVGGLILGDVFEYSNLLSFELLEDGETISSGGLGRAVVGGVLFGGVGAIVGGITGAKKTKRLCNSLRIRVTLKNCHKDTAYIELITKETKTSSKEYKAAQNFAQSCISILQIIADSNQTSSETTHAPSSPTNSGADEILKYKSLLDSGIITQEEFDAKKRQLLGL